MKKFSVFIVTILFLLGGIFFARQLGYFSKKETKSQSCDLVNQPSAPKKIYSLASNNYFKLMITLTSPVFENEQMIPAKYTCQGENINPELQINDVPDDAKSLVLMVDDPDAPRGTWTHWLVWNISIDTTIIGENQVPIGAVEGLNDSGSLGYEGPCPPSGIHRYYFRLYAVDTILDLKEGSGRGVLEASIAGHIIEKTELMGTYEKGKG